VAGLSERFLVKKFGREFLVRIEEINWIEFCGNYVNIHVGFQRVHRSAIVNLDRVTEIIAFDTGDGQAKLKTDALVPISRRYRQELRERLS
jgi:DNA-binding LytR/AlgR family response regulator